MDYVVNGEIQRQEGLKPRYFIESFVTILIQILKNSHSCGYIRYYKLRHFDVKNYPECNYSIA